MDNFFAELKRRHIYRVAAAYAVVAWVALQIVNNVAPALRLPDWAVTLVLVLLAVGFPIALIFAWVHELKTPHAQSAPAKSTGIDYVLAAALIAVIGIFLYQQVASPQASRTAALPSAGPGGISIAVLPFANLSGDVGQEFFSDGVTEEITTALTKVAALRVVGRESAFQFKGQKSDMRAIGQQLGALYLIEGTVRKAGNRVRISAQLTRADSGVNLWAENYDRELKDIFETQSDVAQAIAGALRVPLGLQQGETLVRSRTKDDASYEDYLRAKALVRARREDGLVEAAKLLEGVVAREPDYVPAWALLGLAYDFVATYHPAVLSGAIEQTRQITEASFPKAEAASLRAIQLDPKNSDGYVALAFVQSVRGKFLLAGDSYLQALALDPANPDALNQYSYMLANLGYVKQALPMRQRLQSLEPFVPVFTGISAGLMATSGQMDEAIAMLKPFPLGALYLSEIYAAQGRYGEAADALESIPKDVFLPGTVEAAARLLRAAPRTVASLQSLPTLGVFGWVFIYIGVPDHVLDFREDFLKIGNVLFATLPSMWGQPYASIRKTERFKALVRNAGLVEYWRAKGWPDLCRPQGADDFVCD